MPATALLRQLPSVVDGLPSNGSDTGTVALQPGFGSATGLIAGRVMVPVGRILGKLFRLQDYTGHIVLFGENGEGERVTAIGRGRFGHYDPYFVGAVGGEGGLCTDR